jgi:hypothetical protein
MTPSEAIAKMFQIHMKAEDDLRAVLDQYNAEHRTIIPVERLCYDAMVENQLGHTTDIIPRSVFCHYYSAVEWAANCHYYRAKDLEAQGKGK